MTWAGGGPHEGRQKGPPAPKGGPEGGCHVLEASRAQLLAATRNLTSLVWGSGRDWMGMLLCQPENSVGGTS